VSQLAAGESRIEVATTSASVVPIAGGADLDEFVADEAKPAQQLVRTEVVRPDLHGHLDPRGAEVGVVVLAGIGVSTATDRAGEGDVARIAAERADLVLAVADAHQATAAAEGVVRKPGLRQEKADKSGNYATVHELSLRGEVC